MLAVTAACTFQNALLYHPDPRLLAPDPAGPSLQVVRLTTSDHQRLVAWYAAPTAGKPTLLYFGGNGDSLSGDEPRLRQITAEGVGVLDVGYRGYSGSTGTPTEAGLRLDAEAAYAWLAARTPPQQIVIAGHSLGTGVAVRLAAERPARALVLESPFTSAMAVAQRLLPWAPVSLLMRDRFESDQWIGKAHMPILIVHGDNDWTIPIKQGRALFALANQPKTFVRIPGGGHDDLSEHGLYPQVWRFLGLSPTSSASGAIKPA
jgi:fermentation-respiration switch protein FrsA (DUF1100 family)